MITTSELSVRCISKPSFEEQVFDEFLKEHKSNWIKTGGSLPEKLVEAAGRICYMSFGKERQSPKSNNEYIKHLIKQGHESVLEHINWTFVMSGVSRAFTHQLVRHRVGFAFSQLSQQYHDESDASFIMPKAVQRDKALRETWLDTLKKMKSAYQSLIEKTEKDDKLDAKSKKEKLREIRSSARSILPNATESKLVVTANARSLRHFFEVRGSIDGDLEMRLVASALLDIVKKDAPSVFFDFDKIMLEDETPKVITLEI